MAAMTAEEIRQGLAKLEPNVHWAHHFDLGHGIETVSPEAGRFYRKAIGLNELGALFPSVLRGYMGRSSFTGLRCLDLGSAEGAHSIMMAQDGAHEVIGLDGRQLYVDRASFVAKAKGLDNVRFGVADVRSLDVASLGQFDFVLCSGLLHHLNKDAFLGFTRSLFDLTGDTLMLYTHVSSEWVANKFKLTPSEPLDGGYTGALYQEHEEDSTPEQRIAQVRASLDNVYSFWASEESLVKRFVDLGFRSIVKLYEPAFQKTFIERVFRGIWILRRSAP
jgi:SAM-dependent methyltransferase